MIEAKAVRVALPRTVLVALMIMVLLPNVTGLSNPPTKDSEKNVIDPYLSRMLEMDLDPFRVMVRFSDWPIDEDIEEAEREGMIHISSMKVLPIAVLEGTKEQVLSLASYPRTKWMEYDGEMEFMMEESLSTINATIAWNTWIESTKREFQRIDGTDITVVVLDTGIDAGHPDLDFHEKTIVNLKADIPGAPWYEIENSDTSYGHGTHCAGTIAGNGDASAGARSGVAPNANLIGLCVGDVGITLTNTYYGLEWVYENSKAPNPNNIKIVSNSWGGGAGEYNPEDATSIICQKMTYENNVLVVFAMGNAGSGHHDGAELSASPTGLIPSNIGVAATERDGSGIAYFSSRGEKGKNQTYPDIGAPGVRIWSAHARITMISGMSKIGGNPNPYYLAISGTSMATPHVSGLAALMFQAAPSLTISNIWEDYSGDDPEGWRANELNRVHEIELIMEQSAIYIQPDEVPLSDESNDNGVPGQEDRGETEWGTYGKPIDWAQGYGLVDAEKCVGIALTLENLRRGWPYREWTVKDAIDVYYENGVFHNDVKRIGSDTLYANWEGEFARYAQDQDGPLLVQNQSRLIWVPEGAREISIVMTYDMISIEERTIGDLTFVVDYGYDGSFDYEHPFLGSRLSGVKEATLSVDPSNTGTYWAIGIYGQGFKVIRPFQDREFMELRIEYDIGVSLLMDIPQEGEVQITPPKPNSMVSTWREGDPSSEYQGGEILLSGTKYDLSLMKPLPDEEGEGVDEGFPWGIMAMIVLLAISAAGGYAWYKKRGGVKK